MCRSWSTSIVGYFQLGDDNIGRLIEEQRLNGGAPILRIIFIVDPEAFLGRSRAAEQLPGSAHVMLTGAVLLQRYQRDPSTGSDDRRNGRLEAKRDAAANSVVRHGLQAGIVDQDRNVHSELGTD